LNSNYHPQRLVINYVWDLPLGKPEGVLGKVAEGWSVSGVTAIQDGTPLTLVDTRAGTVFGTAGGNAQLCSGMTYASIPTTGSLDQRVAGGLSSPEGAGFLNGQTQGVFCKPPVLGSDGVATGFGNTGNGILLGPGQYNWDFALAKLTKVHEGQTIQFRAEFFNLFNHPQFSNPNLTVNTSTFGQISSASVSSRIIQLALKYSF
jgi:hypothetical protein